MSLTKETTPTTLKLLEVAGETNGSTAFGDGQFLEWLMKMFEQLLPFFIGCFPAQGARDYFAASMKNLSDSQISRLERAAKRASRRVVPWKERQEREAVAEAAINNLLTAAAIGSHEELATCYDELTN